MADDIAGILLAAGASSRFGSDKLTANFRGKPLVSYAAEALAGAKLEHVIAICRNNIDVKQLFEWRNYKTILNTCGQKPLSTSIKLGLEALAESEASAALIMLADMPLVTTTHLNALTAAFRAKPGLYASGDGDLRSPPAIIPRALWPEILAEGGDQGARGLLKHAQIIAAPPGTLSDIDTVDDLARLSAPR